MNIYKGEQETLSTYIWDEENDTKVDPTTLEDVIIWLYMDYTKEIVRVYSVTGNDVNREGKTYSTTILTLTGDNNNDMEFTIESSDTQDKAPGNIILQLDEVDNGAVINKFKGAIGALKNAM